MKKSLDNAIAGKGSTIFIDGEAGIGKTRLVSELNIYAKEKGINIIQGWCLAESLEPLMPIKTALREAGMFHLISGDPPPKVVSAYLVNDAGMLMNKVEREESGLDPDIFASMLQAVGNFVQDSLSMMNSNSGAFLNSLGYGEYTILLQTSGTLSLATVITGTNSEFLIDDMKRVLKEIGNRFDDWAGDVSKTEEIQPKISWLTDSGKYDGKFLVDDPKIKQENLFDNILLGIQRASMEKPLILFLDDLQWSDPSTLNLVHYLSRNTRDSRVLILGTYRPEDIVEAHGGKTHQLETAMQNMNREDLFEKIELKRLGQEDTGMIINSALGKTSFDDKFLNKIYKETGGTPFFILEIIKLLVEDGSISPTEDGIWELKAELEDLEVPSKVYDVIKRRLDRLIKEQREILECASVVGEEFGSDVVASTIGLNRIQLLKNLSEIEKSHKLIHSFEKKYIFDHAKIREVLYNGIMDELKQEYHRIVADTIAEIHRDNLDEVINELAHHYYEAGDERAGEYLIKAGDMAKERYANEEAIRFYESAIKISGNEANAGIFENLADIQTLIGEYDIAIRYFEKAKESAKDNEVKARNLRKVGDAYVNKGEFDRALKILADAKEVVEEGTAEYGRIVLGEVKLYVSKGEFDKAMPLILEGIEVFDKAGADQKDIANALRAVGDIHSRKGDYGNALQYYEKSLNVMEEINEQHGIAAALNNIGNIYNNKGELERAVKFHERSLEILKKIGSKHGIATALNNIGLVQYIKGELDLAVKFHERSLEIKEKIGDNYGIAMSLNNIGNVHYNKGELDQALEFHERSLEIKEKIGDKWGIAYSLYNIGEMYHDKGEMVKALKYYERSLEISLEIGDKHISIYALCGLAEVKLKMDDVQAGLENAEEGLEMAVDIGAKPEEGMVRRVLGMVHRDMEGWDRAGEEFEKSILILEEVGNKEKIARTLYEQALLHIAMGDPAKARDCLEQSFSEFERMGMKLWAEKCRKALAELDGA